MRTPAVLLLGHFSRFADYLPWTGFYASAPGAKIVRANGPLVELGPEAVVQAVQEQLQRAEAAPA